jgi:hypothetical protein
MRQFQCLNKFVLAIWINILILPMYRNLSSLEYTMNTDLTCIIRMQHLSPLHLERFTIIFGK